MNRQSPSDQFGAHGRMLVLLIACTLVGTGCAKNDSANQSSAIPSSAPTTAGSSGTGATGELMTKLPVYPGASSTAPITAIVSGKHVVSQAYTTADSFDKVYKWYQAALPAHSETSHEASTSEDSALFTLSGGTTTQRVWILKTGGVEVTNINLTVTKE